MAVFEHVVALGRGHDRRLDLAWCPRRLEVLEQRGQAGRVRAGHRGTLDRLEQFTWWAALECRRLRRLASQDLHARRGHVWLADTQRLRRAAARAERGQHVTLRI